MTGTVLAILCTIAVNLGLGGLVYLTNTRRTANQFFLALTVHISLWAASVLMVVQATHPNVAEWWIRAAFFITALFPSSVASLHLAIRYPDDPPRRIYGRSRYFWFISVAAGIFCFSDVFLIGTTMAEPHVFGAVPEALYGPGFTLYVLYFVLTCMAETWRFLRDLHDAEGMQRAELQYVLAGFLSSVAIGGTATLFIPLISDSTQTSQFGPLSTISLTLIVGYGIAKHRIMDVAQMLRRITAYALLTVCLATLYLAAWWCTDKVFLVFGVQQPTAAHLLATLAVAFSMTPAHGHMQRFANQLFINVRHVDIGDTIRQASVILHTITTLPDLLRRFCTMIRDAVDTEHVALLLREGNEYVQKYPPQPGRYPVVTLRDDDPLVLALRRSSDPVVTDVLIRKRPTPGRLALVEKMMSLKVSIAIGIPTHEPMDGIMLLGPRLSGRMFTNVEQDALQILCDQLAVALENARLYTQAQNSKRYNEILLDSLVSGVIAADAEGRVTVFNREACRLTGLNSDDVLQQPTGRLPLPLATVLNDTIENGQELRDLELVLEVDGENIPVRVGSSIFRGTSGNVIGALLVLSDQTQVRKLQAQVRRTDRLASVGTLSAGMAHEIKNPLVSLKTFTQLLPERYDDADFRDTFSSLLSHEVARIDSIVNQLLRFARPTKPELTPANLHEILDKALRLVEQPMQQKGITLDRQLSASTDRIRGDAGLLDQAFLNFFLNAIDAMEGSGQLGVTTEVIDNPWNAGIPDQTRDGPHIVVRISDTGKGIPEQDIPSIFDPFFTTKSEGTGLGLSVTHGIITEHEGTVEVETEPGHGTTFVVSFPLVRDKEPVA